MNKNQLIGLGIAAIVIAVFCHVYANHILQELRAGAPGEVTTVYNTRTVGTGVGVFGAVLLVAGLVRKNEV